MTIVTLESVDGFVVVDLDGAPTSTGVVRLAPKILVDGAELLARSTTYGAAFFELRVGGASAGINCTPDRREAALAAFMEEIRPLVAERRLVLHPGPGLSEAELRAFGAPAPDPEAIAASAVAAAEGILGTLAGAEIAIVGSGEVFDAARGAAVERGAGVSDDGLDAAVDAVFLAGRSGFVDHVAAATVRARAVVPLSPLPVTAKAYAVLGRAGVIYVPDFVALAAPLLAAFDTESAADPVSRVREAAIELAPEGIGAWRAAVDRAETFLTSWRPALPFGRPLA